MSGSNESGSGSPGSDRGRWWLTAAAILTLYPLGMFAATYPRVWHLGSGLPNNRIDPQQAITVMRWYKTCLLEGRSPLINPSIQYPVGAPIGNFSPMHLQSLLYIPLSFLMDDIPAYNVMLYFGLFLTGLGSFVLAWYVLRDRRAAVLAGLLVMLSSPIMGRAWGHLELVYVGVFPLFMVAWMEFVNRPSPRRLALAAGLYTLVAMSAAYFLLVAVFPAGLYAAWHATLALRRRDWAWLRSRCVWLGGFAALAGSAVFVLFYGHMWASAQGYTLERSRYDFERYRAPIWGYFVPTPAFALHQFLPFDFYTAAKLDETVGERQSYLGVVTALLLYYAAVRKVSFRGGRYWWSALGVLVVLSMGPYFMLGEHKVALPGGWLWNHVSTFRMLRVPARFNSFAAVCAGVIAAAGLSELLSRMRYRGSRALLCGGLALFAMYDLHERTIPSVPLAQMPPCYDFIKRRNPEAALLEVPQVMPHSGSLTLSTDAAYWQGTHGLRTSAGYSGQLNVLWEDRLAHSSPFLENRLADPSYPGDPEKGCIDLVCLVSFRDYTWLYLAANRFSHLVIHQGEEILKTFPNPHLARVKDLLQGGVIYEDDRTCVIESDLIPPPQRPTILCTDGWRQRVIWKDRMVSLTAKLGKVALYNPDADRPMQFVMDAASIREPRRVQLKAGDRVLGAWEVKPDAILPYVTPPFRLPAGLQDLTLESDGEILPSVGSRPATEIDPRPSSLRVALMFVNPLEQPTRNLAEADAEGKTVR